MAIWHLDYYEAGASTAYMGETLFSIEDRDSAVLQFLRLGGNDTLKITLWNGSYIFDRLKNALGFGSDNGVARKGA